MKRQPVGHVKPVVFFIVHSREVLFALLYYHVTGRASAVAAASMLEIYAVVERYVEKRAFFPVLMIRSHARLVFNSNRLFTFTKKGDFMNLLFSFRALLFHDCAFSCFHNYLSATSEALRSLSAA